MRNHLIQKRQYSITDCQFREFVGDGFCHDFNNNFHCGFDRGDCCGPCVNKENCTRCECKTGNTEDIKNSLVGDGYCNDETNTANCSYDGGDCCGENVISELCSECECKLQETCAAGHYSPLVGDGYCHDEFNNPDCLYDGLDCCGLNVNTDFCSECSCHSKYYSKQGSFLTLGF